MAGRSFSFTSYSPNPYEQRSGNPSSSSGSSSSQSSSSTQAQSYTPSSGNNDDLETMYQRLLDTFQGSNDSYMNDYRELLNASNQNNLAYQQQQQQNDMALMNEQYRNMASLAKDQASDWLKYNSQLMSESSVFRSQESKQQYEQDRVIQGDKLGSDQLMQQRQFKQDMDVINENEAIEVRRRNSDRRSAMGAYKNL